MANYITREQWAEMRRREDEEVAAAERLEQQDRERNAQTHRAAVAYWGSGRAGMAYARPWGQVDWDTLDQNARVARMRAEEDAAAADYAAEQQKQYAAHFEEPTIRAAMWDYYSQTPEGKRAIAAHEAQDAIPDWFHWPLSAAKRGE